MFQSKIILSKILKSVFGSIFKNFKCFSKSAGCCNRDSDEMEVASGTWTFEECEVCYGQKDILTEVILRADMAMLQRRLYLNQDITLDVLAREVWSNRTYLSKAISKKRGITFRQYVNGYRLLYAANELLEKGYGLEDIAIASGFRNTRMFCNALRESESVVLESLKKRYLYKKN